MTTRVPCLDPEKTLLVFALETEAEGLFDDFEVVYTGIGKINAAYSLTRALESWKKEKGTPPSLVLNLGSAGSSVFDVGAVVNCTGFVQRDFDITAIGAPPYSAIGEDIPVPLQTGLRYPLFPEGICGTGDSFVTEAAKTLWNVVDMESYALAKVCYLEKITFASLKYITDDTDGQDAADVWSKTVSKSAQALFDAVKSIVC